MKKILIVYWLITLALPALCISYLGYGISLKGYWTERILTWVWIAMTIVVLISNAKKRWVKSYLIGLILTVILSMVPMMLPFISLAAFVTAQDREASFVIDSKLRLEEIFAGVLGPPKVILIENLGVFEKVIGYTDYEFHVNDNFIDIENGLFEYEPPLRLRDVKAINIAEISREGNIKLKFVFEEGIVVREF